MKKTCYIIDIFEETEFFSEMNLIPVAEDGMGNLYCYNFADGKSKIVFWDTEIPTKKEFVCNTFTEFIKMLHEENYYWGKKKKKAVCNQQDSDDSSSEELNINCNLIFQDADGSRYVVRENQVVSINDSKQVAGVRDCYLNNTRKEI